MGLPSLSLRFPRKCLLLTNWYCRKEFHVDWLVPNFPLPGRKTIHVVWLVIFFLRLGYLGRKLLAMCGLRGISVCKILYLNELRLKYSN